MSPIYRTPSYISALGQIFGLVTLREFHGFKNLPGSWVGYTGVRVWVAKFVPSQNPYPQEAGTGFGRFFRGFSQYFSLPYDSTGIHRNGTGIHRNETGIHRNDWIPAGMELESSGIHRNRTF
jgi:hypothetical protein